MSEPAKPAEPCPYQVQHRGPYLVTTRVTAALCRRCDAVVLTGIAEGLPVRANPQPVTVAGEITALLSGRASYTLARGELVTRDATRIRSLHGPVLVEHRCWRPIPSHHRAYTTGSNPTLPTVPTRPDGQFPF